MIFIRTSRFAVLIVFLLLNCVYAQSYEPSSRVAKDKYLKIYNNELSKMQQADFIIKYAMVARNLNGPPSAKVYLDSCRLAVVNLYPKILEHKYVNKNNLDYSYNTTAKVYYKQFKYAWYNTGALVSEIYQCLSVYSGNDRKGILLMYVYQFGKWKPL